MPGQGMGLQTRALVLLGLVPLLGASDGAGSSQSGAASSDGSSGNRTTMQLGAVSGGYRWFGPPYYTTIGPNGLPVVIYPQPLWAPAPVVVPVVVVDRGPLGGPVPRLPQVQVPPAPAAAARGPKAPPGKVDQLLVLGDRLFRAGNLKRAEERYRQAARLDASEAEPRIRLAQIAIVREQYAEAAQCVRDAVAADPEWLIRAEDIQPVYAEPRDFDRTIARLESRLLLEPGDRDAWFVLGAQLYLAGQTRRAADVFLRLTDRKPDAALAAFLEASRPSVVPR